MKKLLLISIIAFTCHACFATADSASVNNITYISFNGKGNSVSFKKETIAETPSERPIQEKISVPEPAQADTVIEPPDTVERKYEHRKRPTVREWINMQGDSAKLTYTELAEQRKEHWAITTVKSLLLFPIYAVMGGCAGLAAASLVFTMLMLLGFGGMGIAATFPFAVKGFLVFAASAAAGFTLFYITELPFFDKARPIALFPYKAIGYILLGLFYLLFWWADTFL